MKHLSILILLSSIAAAAIYDVYTEDLSGRLVIEKRDHVIVDPSHSLASSTFTTVVVCSTNTCRKDYIDYMKNLYRTNGISVITVK